MTTSDSNTKTTGNSESPQSTLRQILEELQNNTSIKLGDEYNQRQANYAFADIINLIHSKVIGEDEDPGFWVETLKAYDVSSINQERNALRTEQRKELEKL